MQPNTPRTMRCDRSPTPLPARIETSADLDRWRDERGEADAALSGLTGERARMLTSASVDALARKDAEIATARLRAERAAAVVVQAERRATETEAREAAKEPERRKRYAVGKKAAAEAERIMRTEYEPAAAQLAAVLGRLAALQPAIEAANADLPADAVRLDPDAFRGLAATPGRHERRLRAVAIDADGARLHGHITAFRADATAEPWARHENGAVPQARQEAREEQEWIPGSAAVPADSLLTSTAIPGLRWDDPAHWPPKD
ncbi:hypothetical protein HNR00_004023 [Methylorubrum rhodinum]|uniref:Uncharacterized protein n=1 Tax=Methylorubrum rhodinum TaxID=29428 RepID=A0A840ZQY9_9HYPH|nr:hypothetical protein [Methylorubrum rhodinum]MBB5759291.1 hypothetical protein [Methylorubrum rhodinum]